MSKFTSILKNIGLVAAEAGLNYIGLGELASKLIKTPAPPPAIIPQKLQDIWDAIKAAEFTAATLKDTKLTGEQKRSLVIPSLTHAILQIDDFAGHKPEDEVAFQANIDLLVNALVGIGNSFKK
jgi:hypothetical protein